MGGGSGRVGGGGQGGCEWRSEAFVKIQKKNFFLEGGGVWSGGGGGGSGWGGSGWMGMENCSFCENSKKGGWSGGGEG